MRDNLDEKFTRRYGFTMIIAPDRHLPAIADELPNLRMRECDHA
jgi:hypothetical protein